jgi:hypothetical protein
MSLILLTINSGESSNDASELERMWGDTHRFCPVALTNQKVLIPGNSKLSAKWKVLLLTLLCHSSALLIDFKYYIELLLSLLRFRRISRIYAESYSLFAKF